ncbi:CRTAC1 family protein [Roseobacter sinensis]|uniref:CRTAC1 family protein n=1 Tax=Roseobacter sinensis TaxID=2931391 RepID=A0ABT3BHW3_9RHOB|nr:CRTAC1 family protein [Roseobacter sp. WL0113]MCV3273163.1 CRTAC1 family protein [Roseobacter sp. WL0113]
MACLLAPTAQAEVLFEDLSANLPHHVYSGGWEHFVGGGVAVFDCNGDALPDLLAAGGESPAVLMINQGGMRFEAGPLPRFTGSTGAYPLDADGDGHLDVMLLRVGENQLLRGDGACGFSSANADLGFEGGDAWSTGFSATWTGDGAVFAIGNYVDRKDPDGPFEACDDNSLHRWNGQHFVAEPLSPGFCALSILFARDATGETRLRLSNDRHYYVRDGAEQMYDLSARRFLGPEDGWETVRLWGMGIASRDITGDGRAEVMLTSMGDQLMQIAGDDGLYSRAPYSLGTYAQRPHVGDDGRPSTGWHAEFGDVNNDARPDLFIAKGNVDQMPGLAMEDPNTLLIQQPDGTFAERSVEAGVATVARSRGAALADLDGDGRLDLVVMNRRAPIELYRNVTPETGHWLAIELRMEGANTRAVGALLEVTAGDVSQVQEVTVGGGHAGGQAGPLHFGLGEAESAQIRVIWPDGRVTSHTDVAANQHLTLGP